MRVFKVMAFRGETQVHSWKIVSGFLTHTCACHVAGPLKLVCSRFERRRHTFLLPNRCSVQMNMRVGKVMISREKTKVHRWRIVSGLSAHTCACHVDGPLKLVLSVLKNAQLKHHTHTLTFPHTHTHIHNTTSPQLPDLLFRSY